MTMEKRIEKLKKNCNAEEYDLIGIYEDKHAYECYNGHMAPWSNDRHMVYPVAWNPEVKTMGSLIGGTVSAIFFGTRYVSDEEFMKEKVMDALEKLGYNSKEIKIVQYKIVN